MNYLIVGWVVCVVVLNACYLFALFRRPAAKNFVQMLFALSLLGFAGLSLYTFGNTDVSEHEILAKSDGTVLEGPASSFQLSSEPHGILLAREDCIFKKFKHGKDMIAVTVRYKAQDEIKAERLYEILSAEEATKHMYFRNYLKSQIKLPVEVPSNEALIALALQASFLKYNQAGVLVTVQSVVVIEDGATMRRFNDE